MRTRKEIIVDAMSSMLASASLEAMPGITLDKFLQELEFLREYPKNGEEGKFTPAQKRYIKSVLDCNFRNVETGGQRYYIGQGPMF